MANKLKEQNLNIPLDEIQSNHLIITYIITQQQIHHHPFPNMIVASSHKGKTTSDAINHLLYIFSVLGLPLQPKTDSSPAYTSKHFKVFCNLWNINHVTRIPYNS